MGKLLLKLSVLLLLCTALYSTVGCGKPEQPQKDESEKVDPQKQYKQNIVKVIKLDHELSVPIDASYSSNLSDNEKLDEYARRIFNYTKNAKKALNSDELPSDFVSAYIDHLNAWQEKAQEVSNHPNMDPLINAAESFLYGFTLDFSSISNKQTIHNKWNSRLRQTEDDISSTWKDVEVVAAKYGVNINNCE